MEYTTLSRLKSKLGIATEETSSDTELSLIITDATQLIDNFLGCNLAVREITERISGTGSNKLYLKNTPTSIKSIQDKDGYITYILDFLDGYIAYIKDDIIPKGNKNIIVVYDSGYTEVPGEIESICLDLCVILCDQRGIKGANSEKLINKNIQTQKLGNLSITYFSQKEKKKNSFDVLDPSIETVKILNKYKPFTGVNY